MTRVSEGAAAWLKTRGLRPATLEALPAASGTTFFPDLGTKSEAIFFRYKDGWKARSYPDKGFVAGGGFKPSFWNLEAVLDAKPSTVFVTEGELDAASLVEAGIPAYQVLSVPTGAKLKPQDDPKGARGYAYVLEALEAGLGAVKRFVWCGDADGPGNALRADFARLLGAAKFYYVTWPEGINDANDMLVKDGADALHDRVNHGALPWPQEGLYKFHELPEPPPLTIWNTQMPGFEGRVHLAPKTLSVVTGQPGHGKTIFFNELWYGVVKSYDLVCCIASFETRPKPHLRRQIRTLLTGKLEYDMTEVECVQADSWINDHYLFLHHPKQTPTLDWFLDCAETAVVRHGAKIVQIDPWNRLEATRARDESETDYILRCLRALYVFANDMDCHVQVIAHPAKMDGPRRHQPPMLEDISGSKHWENVVDQGFTIHRPQMYEGQEQRTYTDFYHRKARFEELGHPTKIALNYDLAQRRYVALHDPSEGG